MNSDNNEKVEEIIDSMPETHEEEVMNLTEAAEVQKEESVSEEQQKNDVEATSVSNISKIKIRDILKQRFKKYRPSLKKGIPFILVGILCFVAGIGVDRAVLGRNYNRNYKIRSGIEQGIPKKGLNNKQEKRIINKDNIGREARKYN